MDDDINYMQIPITDPEDEIREADAKVLDDLYQQILQLREDTLLIRDEINRLRVIEVELTKQRDIYQAKVKIYEEMLGIKNN